MPHTKTELLTADELTDIAQGFAECRKCAACYQQSARLFAHIAALTKERDNVIEECVQAILEQKEREGWLGGSIARGMIQVVRSLKSTNNQQAKP